MAHDISAQANAWIEMTKLGDQAADDCFDEGFQLNLLVQDHPRVGWEVIKQIVSRYAECDPFADRNSEGALILSNLGAGPLESLLNYHGQDFVDDVEIAANNDPAMRWTVSCVWRSRMPHEVWDRVQHITGGFSP